MMIASRLRHAVGLVVGLAWLRARRTRRATPAPASRGFEALESRAMLSAAMPGPIAWPVPGAMVLAPHPAPEPAETPVLHAADHETNPDDPFNDLFDHGLTGQYFGNADLTGLALTRRDLRVKFGFGRGAPATVLERDGFSIR